MQSEEYAVELKRTTVEHIRARVNSTNPVGALSAVLDMVTNNYEAHTTEVSIQEVSVRRVKDVNSNDI